jgi:hypothetical protein
MQKLNWGGGFSSGQILVLHSFIHTHTYLYCSVKGPLLCNNCEMGSYTRAVSGQRLGKHVPVARQLSSMPRCYKQGTSQLIVSSIWEAVKSGLELEAEE